MTEAIARFNTSGASRDSDSIRICRVEVGVGGLNLHRDPCRLLYRFIWLQHTSLCLSRVRCGQPYTSVVVRLFKLTISFSSPSQTPECIYKTLRYISISQVPVKLSPVSQASTTSTYEDPAM